MTGLYYTDMLDIVRAAGVAVRENATTNGWQRRARSSGGFPSPPLGVQWHHTASSTRPENDVAWQITGNGNPIGNMLLDRDGAIWPIAAGAANTAGKGGPLAMSRGTVPVDQANSRTWAIEAANNGVGETWPTAQIDAYFAVSNALNARFGNRPSDVFNHNTWAPTRKIDPAINTSVTGPWRPGRSTSSGTWTQGDVTAECGRRAANPPTPTPEDDVTDDDIERIVNGVWQKILTPSAEGWGPAVAQQWLTDTRIQLAANQPPTVDQIADAVWSRMLSSDFGETWAARWLMDTRAQVAEISNTITAPGAT